MSSRSDLIEILVAKTTNEPRSQSCWFRRRSYGANKRGPRAPGLLDLLFGPVQWPGRLRVFFQFLLNYRDAKLCSGEPFNLQELIDNNPDLTDARGCRQSLGTRCFDAWSEIGRSSSAR